MVVGENTNNGTLAITLLSKFLDISPPIFYSSNLRFFVKNDLSYKGYERVVIINLSVNFKPEIRT